jgi:hypothetical protein
MTDKQPRALMLANELETKGEALGCSFDRHSAELRGLHAENEALKAAQYECGFGAGCCYQAAKSEADEALLRQALECLTYTAPRHDCIDAATEYERMSEAAIAALRERLNHTKES